MRSFGPLLKEHRYAARAACDANAAFDDIERGAPAAILLDLHLPIVDGLEFLRRLRSSRHAAIPVAMMTGDYLIDDRIADELRTLGARLYFKPLWEEDLVQIVAELLEIRRRDDVNRHRSSGAGPSHAVGT